MRRLARARSPASGISRLADGRVAVWYRRDMITERETEGGKVMGDVATVAVVVALAVLMLLNVFITIR